MISIAMATYNGAKYLKEQIDSILNQSIQDFELVVCDDCSDDETLAILKEYQDVDKRIRVYNNESNLGFKKNFEKAMSLCEGEYIALSDQDDIWMPNHLEILLNAIGNNVLACGNADIVDENGCDLGMTLKEQETLDYIPKDNLKKALSILIYRNPYQGASMLMKRDLLIRIIPFPNGIEYHDTWIALVSCFCGGLVYVDDILLKYRRTGNNVTIHKAKARSRYKHFRRHILWKDRIPMIDTITVRCGNLSRKQTKMLNHVRTMLLRNDNKWGRKLNDIYRVMHIKTIYSAVNLKDIYSNR